MIDLAMTDFKLRILGCGSALPTIRHNASSQILEFRNKQFLIDCGEGTQVQLRRMRIGFTKIAHIFISHLHGDHCFGLPGLLSSMSLQGRVGEVVIHGPAEVETFLKPIISQFCQGITFDIRFNHVDTTTHSLIYEDKSINVYSIPLRHRIPTTGFLFAEKPKEPHIIKDMTDAYDVPLSFMKSLKAGEDFVTPDGEVVPNSRLTRPADAPKKYAYCSDTAYNPSIISIIEGADLLYHEATFASDMADRAKQTFHSTAAQAATIAKDAQVKRLLIGHYSARYENLDALFEEAKKIFPNVTLANEGMKIDI
jgi:ribonuclease Z